MEFEGRKEGLLDAALGVVGAVWGPFEAGRRVLRFCFLRETPLGLSSPVLSSASASISLHASSEEPWCTGTTRSVLGIAWASVGRSSVESAPNDIPLALLWWPAVAEGLAKARTFDKKLDPWRYLAINSPSSK